MSLAALPSIEVSTNTQRTSYFLRPDKQEINIGRDRSNDIVIDAPVVSHFHAQIVREGKQLILIHPHPSQSHTTNGLLYQGRHILGNEPFRKPLVQGDIFRIGDEHGALVTLTYNDGSGAPQESVPKIRPLPGGMPVLPIGSQSQPPQTQMKSQAQTAVSHTQGTAPQPPRPPGRRSPKKFKGIATLLGGLLAGIAALVAILQFMGVAHIQDIFIHPTPTPTPLPFIAERTYDSPRPGCDTSKDPSDIIWRITGATNTCPSSGGTALKQTELQSVPELIFRAATGYQLASNETISANFSGIANDTCAGLGTRQDNGDAAGYAFFICGDGDWYILKYSRQGGTPVVLSQSSSTTQVSPSNQYNLTITVDNNTLQMAIGGGGTYTVQDSDYTVTDLDSILMSEEAVITTYRSADFAASVTVSDFHYEQA